MAANDTTRARRFYERGVYYYERGRWSDASESLRDAVAIYPEHSRARLYLGAALAHQRAYLDAIQVLEDGRHQPNVSDGEMAELVRLLSTICIIRRDLPAAEYYLREAIDLGASDADTHNKLGSVLCQSGEFGSAFDLYLGLAREQTSK